MDVDYKKKFQKQLNVFVTPTGWTRCLSVSSSKVNTPLFVYRQGEDALPVGKDTSFCLQRCPLFVVWTSDGAALACDSLVGVCLSDRLPPLCAGGPYNVMDTSFCSWQRLGPAGAHPGTNRQRWKRASSLVNKAVVFHRGMRASQWAEPRLIPGRFVR